MKLPGPIQKMADELAEPDASSMAEEAPAEEQQPSEPAKEPEHDWKQRFTGYKASTDRTIHELRTALSSKDENLAQLQFTVDELSKRLAEAEKVIPQKKVHFDVLSEDDIESLGEDNVDRMARIAKAQIDQQRRELDAKLNAIQAKQLRIEQERQEQEARSEHQKFWDKVRELVPDVDKIDKDPAFAEFLNQPEEYSGHTYREIGRYAKQMGDVRRTADLYLAFKNTRSAPTRDVSPVGVGSNPAPRSDGKKVWTKAEYEKAVRDQYRRGPMTPQREAAIEKLHQSYYQALREGRVKRN